MILSDKYIIVEDRMNITLSERYLVDEKVDGVPTGNKVKREKVIGYYSPTVKGRTACYQRMMSCEIADSEKQDLQNILEVVQKMSDQVEAFWKECK
ncbi:hypothetical protein KUA24_128 [Vibrio phage HNL01]|nr:hypothetical protein KUA24_128 [Vibrio phage HNL01]